MNIHWRPSPGKRVPLLLACDFCHGSGLAFQGNRALRRGRKDGAGYVDASCRTCFGTGRQRFSIICQRLLKYPFLAIKYLALFAYRGFRASGWIGLCLGVREGLHVGFLRPLGWGEDFIRV